MKKCPSLELEKYIVCCKKIRKLRSSTVQCVCVCTSVCRYVCLFCYNSSLILRHLSLSLVPESKFIKKEKAKGRLGSASVNPARVHRLPWLEDAGLKHYFRLPAMLVVAWYTSKGGEKEEKISWLRKKEKRESRFTNCSRLLFLRDSFSPPWLLQLGRVVVREWEGSPSGKVETYSRKERRRETSQINLGFFSPSEKQSAQSHSLPPVLVSPACLGWVIYFPGIYAWQKTRLQIKTNPLLWETGKDLIFAEKM